MHQSRLVILIKIKQNLNNRNYDISSIAMVYVNYFFIKKSYIQYEKLVSFSLKL